MRKPADTRKTDTLTRAALKSCRRFSSNPSRYIPSCYSIFHRTNQVVPDHDRAAVESKPDDVKGEEEGAGAGAGAATAWGLGVARLKFNLPEPMPLSPAGTGRRQPNVPGWRGQPSHPVAQLPSYLMEVSRPMTASDREHHHDRSAKTFGLLVDINVV